MAHDGRDTRGGGSRNLASWRGLLPGFGRWSDPYLLYTASLGPVVIVVALLARRPGEVWLATALTCVAVVAQLALMRLTPASVRRRRVTWPLMRLVVPLAYVGAAVQLIGGPALPLLALFVPIVAGAAAVGSTQGVVTAAVAAVIYLGPQITNLGSPAAVVLRGVTLAGVALVIAFGTRRIVAALEEAARRARAAAASERRRTQQIEALETVGRLLAAGGPSAELIDRSLEVIVRRFGFTNVSVYLGDEARVALVAQRGYGDALPAFQRGHGVAGRVMQNRELAFVPDVTADADYVPGTVDARSLISAPLLIDGRFLGVLNVESIGARRLDETDRALVTILAQRLATAVALGQDRRALGDRARLFAEIGAFAQAVSARQDIDQLAEAIAGGVCRVLEADAVSVTLLDRATGRYLVRAVQGAAAMVGDEVRIRDDAAGSAIRDRATVVYRPGPASVPSAGSRRVLGETIAQPLIRDGVVVGALTVARSSDRPPFADLEREGLELVGSHAALAVANAFLHEDVKEMAVRDSLTGLYNRRYFDEALDRLLANHRRDRLSDPRTISAITFDLDYFGRFNKQHGHLVGDAVLRAFADVLRDRFRRSDLVARTGGEEFVAILDGGGRDQAINIAEEIRRSIAEKAVTADDGTPLHVTVSAGCAELDPSDPTRENLLRTADVALFMAKRAGRDRVVAA